MSHVRNRYVVGRKWFTGKSCQEKGSKETKGTKKDTKYLRALQDCKAQGQAPGVLQCVVVCCSVLPFVAACGTVLQCVAV